MSFWTSRDVDDALKVLRMPGSSDLAPMSLWGTDGKPNHFAITDGHAIIAVPASVHEPRYPATHREAAAEQLLDSEWLSVHELRFDELTQWTNHAARGRVLGMKIDRALLDTVVLIVGPICRRSVRIGLAVSQEMLLLTDGWTFRAAVMGLADPAHIAPVDLPLRGVS